MNEPRPVTAMLNHLLRATPVAMERLRPFAGRTAEFRVGPLTFAWTVQTTGEVTAAGADIARDLEVALSPFLLPRLASGDETALGGVTIKGDARFAQEVSFLARHLRWDAEEDLARVVGDAAAHRAVDAASATARWANDAALRAAQGAAEYWTEEKPLIASRVKVEDFTRGVAELRDGIERLEARLDQLGDSHRTG